MPAMVTICIPTYNRAELLEFLLNNIRSQITTGLADLFSIVVSDNASTDRTSEVVSKYLPILPLVYFRQPSNVGGYSNIINCFSQVKTEYFVYCADDDYLDMRVVANIVSFMSSQPDLGAFYAPWMLESGATKQKMLSFFPTIETTRFKKGDLRTALRTVLDNNLFPEIAVLKASVVELLPPQSSTSFWYFMTFMAAVKNWDVIISDTSQMFYTSFLDHPSGTRAQQQVGNAEVATSWDTYRGGMEVFTRAAERLGKLPRAEVTSFLLKINEFVASRQIVAMRAKCKAGDYIDAFYLSSRISLHLPQNISNDLDYGLKVAASIEYCYKRKFVGRPNRKACLVGPFPKPFVALLKEHGLPWFVSENDAGDSPRIAWDPSDGVAADAYALTFLRSVQF